MTSNHPGKGARPLIPCLISLVAFLLSCPMGGCRRGSYGSPAPQLTDLRSQISGVEELLEEFRKQLQQQRHQDGYEKQRSRPIPERDEEGMDLGSDHRQVDTTKHRDLEEEAFHGVGIRPGGVDSGEDLCNFNQLEDHIIRTKDSLEAGATFLKAPTEVSTWRQCLEVCCARERCSAAVVERSGRGLSCFLFDCTYRGRNVCQFSPHRDYSSYIMSGRNTTTAWPLGGALHPKAAQQENDNLPHSNAGQDVVLQLPIDWVILDGRESNDDHGIIQYDWSLLRGDPLVDMKVLQPGTLKLSHLQEGVYTLQLTVTDTSGQKSSDNVSVSVIPAEHHDTVNSRRKTIVHISESTKKQDAVGDTREAGNHLSIENAKNTNKKNLLSENIQKINPVTQELNHKMLSPGTDLQPTTMEPKGQIKNTLGTASSKLDQDTDINDFLNSKDIPQGSGHPHPETGAVLPLALGLLITALLLLMVACRLHLVKQKLKKARPLTTEESDYLINGMYL
ncbi:hypothetical protein GDO86_009546 [Hymenochirus boettgeri]|uniref:Low-density lipoprotein receptor-related protein 11 n=1 Tax=Hymenochirus boettgeri TaxID=247094 RepID=A0A8T2JGU4_9PIPI|nr:hypothetical protein GDO86_009546 [Hymenochirus boettgeri]